jgi:tetrahydromethanopterin S-methyltransferase subunit H
MKEFPTEQQVVRLGPVAIGGQPGERPTVVIPSFFYNGHQVVTDPDAGIIDAAAFQEEFQAVAEMAQDLGNPLVVDVVASSASAMDAYVRFMADHTEVPLFLDGTNDEVRIAGVRTANEIGIADRVVYNSIGAEITPQGLTAIQEMGVKTALLLAFDQEHYAPGKRMDLIRGSAEHPGGMVQMAREAGVEQLLVDTAVMDIPAVTFAAAIADQVKSELGLPVGCGPHNAITIWRHKKKYGKPGQALAEAAVVNYVQTLGGADFILTGNAKSTLAVLPSIALVDGMQAYYRKRVAKKPVEAGGPMKNFL